MVMASNGSIHVCLHAEKSIRYERERHLRLCYLSYTMDIERYDRCPCWTIGTLLQAALEVFLDHALLFTGFPIRAHSVLSSWELTIIALLCDLCELACTLYHNEVN